MAESLFGPTPEELRAALRQQQDEFSQRAAQVSPAYSAGAGVGSLLGGIVGSVFGVENPELKKAKQMEAIQQKIMTENPSLSDQGAYYDVASYELANAGFGREAMQAAQMANKFRQEQGLYTAQINKEEAQTSKLTAEAANKQAEVDREQLAAKTLQTLYANKTALGQVPTSEEIISAVAPFVPADKLASMMQTSSDKAAYRDTMIEQAKTQAEAKIEAAKERGATQLQIAQLMASNKMDIATLTASLKGEKGLTGREARYSDNVAIAGNEVIGGINNLINMPFTSSTGVFGSGVGAIQSSESIFGAPIGALKNRVTPDNVKRYNTEISNIGKFYGTLQSGGLAVPASVQKQFEQQFSIKDGDDELTRLTRLAQMRQTFERVIQVKKKSKNTPAEQQDMWDAWEEQVKTSIPITVNDVNKIANNKNKTQTMADAMGKADLLSKSITTTAAAPAGGLQEGLTGTSKSGKPMVVRNGKWEYK